MKVNRRHQWALDDLMHLGRWGTCAACPRDHQGRAIIQACPETGRCDHQLTWENLRRLLDLRFSIDRCTPK